ncbi:MAG: hypothetical protein II779_07580, partial [Clostridia bacterium]|nr:hypothetical protein [Clostridia bacterium]
MLKTDTSIGNKRGTEAEQSPRKPETDMRTQARDRSPIRLLILTEGPSDLTEILESCGAAVTRMSPKEAVGKDLAEYDAFCVLAYGKVLDPRLRVRLEEEAAKGKRIFT